MRKSDIIIENERLKSELEKVCEYHKRALDIIDEKTDKISELEARLKSAEKEKIKST